MVGQQAGGIRAECTASAGLVPYGLPTLYATTASPVLLLVQVRIVFGGLSARFATFFHSKISTCRGGGAVWR